LANPSDPNEAAKARRQRLLRRAMENLGALPTSRASSTTATEPNLPVVDAARVAPKDATPKPTADDLQLKAQVEKRYEELQKKRELYAILGVPVGGAKDQVKAAFLTMAKMFHPDRLPPSLPELAPKMTAVFESIRDAYETLYDDAKRATYMSQVATGGPPKGAAPRPPGQDPGEAMRAGEAAFKKRDYRVAEAQFAKAHELDKAGASLAAQAWAIYMDPSRKADAQTAKNLMANALKIDQNCDRAHYQLGVIARVEGDMDRAERHFRDAVRANPRHLEANQELRLIEMRKKKATTPKGGGGFFSR
jgi:curved DNA-binding protein CbpA